MNKKTDSKGLSLATVSILGQAPSLLESTYQQCLAYELKINQIDFRGEYPLLVKYKEIFL